MSEYFENVNKKTYVLAKTSSQLLCLILNQTILVYRYHSNLCVEAYPEIIIWFI